MENEMRENRLREACLVTRDLVLLQLLLTRTMTREKKKLSSLLQSGVCTPRVR